MRIGENHLLFRRNEDSLGTVFRCGCFEVHGFAKVLAPLDDLADYISRINIIANLDSPMTIENANRIIRILKDSSFDKVDEGLFVDDAEKRLYECVKEVSFTNDYENYIKQLIGLNAQIDNFFEKVLVMDKDENIKNNRIALLTILKNYYEKIADFSVLRA